MAIKISNLAKIDRKWQKRWENKKAFLTKDNVKGKKKHYILEMYAYPSGTGIHMGHVLNYTIGDIQARLKRMQGFNVLYPTGFDSFGLPAENAAIKAKAHPKKFTEDAIRNFTKQIKSLGISYDWTRIVRSHDPEYYKWDQWIFLKMFERGLAYRKKSPVNFCGKCKTVLANEQVINGKCWRHEDESVQVKQLEQWFLKTTVYAEELLRELDRMDGWPEFVKKLQRNWIGKSEGTEVDFEIVDEGGKRTGRKWPVFTTRVDTLFGVTFLVVSAQHPELMDLVTEKQKKSVTDFLEKVKSTKDEDLGKLEKEGVFTGSYAKHPLTNEKIPIWTGNFVVADYGSGMVMAVPAHDQRDFEFANKYGLDINMVICPHYPKKTCPVLKEAYTGYGHLVDSEGFDGLKSEEAKEHITTALEIKKKGRKKVVYKLKDWLISRQRFWGTPIPIVYCEKCGIVPVKEKELPVKLPENIKFSSVENPLKSYKPFVNVKCPKCGKTGRRETDTMDTFVNSSWYFLRFCDPGNTKKIFDSKKADYWMPIDQYIGGKEHAYLHLIYFRFYTKFLRDLGVLDKKIKEPAIRLFNQGYIYGKDGKKMSKSLGNVINPDDIVVDYGADALRMFLVSVASPDKDFNWDDKGVEGSFRFVLKVMNFVEDFKSEKMAKLNESKFNRLVRDYTSDIDGFRYNLAVIKLREMFSILEKECDKGSLEAFLKLFGVICPHIAEELWEKIGNKGFISLTKWPKFDKKKIDDKLEEQESQIEKVIEDVKNILKIVEDKGKTSEKVYFYVLPDEKGNYNVDELSEKIGIDVMVFAVNDRGKYDPEEKSKKAKPGRPGIYVE